MRLFIIIKIQSLLLFFKFDKIVNFLKNFINKLFQQYISKEIITNNYQVYILLFYKKQILYELFI